MLFYSLVLIGFNWNCATLYFGVSSKISCFCFADSFGEGRKFLWNDAQVIPCISNIQECPPQTKRLKTNKSSANQWSFQWYSAINNVFHVDWPIPWFCDDINQRALNKDVSVRYNTGSESKCQWSVIREETILTDHWVTCSGKQSVACEWV